MTISTAPVLAVIPARGGSKGLPGKNIRQLAGLPLIAHSIKLAKLCPEIHTLIVSTDSQEIADIAMEFGAEVPFLRPSELAGDAVGTLPVLQHALSAMNAKAETEFGSVLLLDPTSPGRMPEHVREACHMLNEDGTADGVVACSQPKFNPFFVGVVEADGYMQLAFGTQAHTHRQDVPKFLRVNGSLYLWRAEFIKTAPATWLTAGKHRILEMPEDLAFSIDDLMEFEVANFVIANGFVKLPWLESREGVSR